MLSLVGTLCVTRARLSSFAIEERIFFLKNIFFRNEKQTILCLLWLFQNRDGFADRQQRESVHPADFRIFYSVYKQRVILIG